MDSPQGQDVVAPLQGRDVVPQHGQGAVQKAQGAVKPQKAQGAVKPQKGKSAAKRQQEQDESPEEAMLKASKRRSMSISHKQQVMLGLKNRRLRKAEVNASKQATAFFTAYNEAHDGVDFSLDVEPGGTRTVEIASFTTPGVMHTLSIVENSVQSCSCELFSRGFVCKHLFAIARLNKFLRLPCDRSFVPAPKSAAADSGSVKPADDARSDRREQDENKAPELFEELQLRDEIIDRVHGRMERLSLCMALTRYAQPLTNLLALDAILEHQLLFFQACAKGGPAHPSEAAKLKCTDFFF